MPHFTRSWSRACALPYMHLHWQEMGAEDEGCMAAVNHVAFPINQPPVTEGLQEATPHVCMSLVHVIKEYHRSRTRLELLQQLVTGAVLTTDEAVHLM